MVFGVFNNFWDKHPDHLPLLNLLESEYDSKDWNLQLSLSKLYAILNASSDEETSEGIGLLLQSEDWRPHLVACISLLAISVAQRDRYIDTLWHKVFSGSWVSPQILVVLSLIDKDFTSKAEKILAEGLSVTFSSIPPLEHHLSRGGAGKSAANGKAIAAIHYLLYKDLQGSIESDLGGDLAKEWSGALLESIKKGKILFERF